MAREDKLVERITYLTKIALGTELNNMRGIEVDKDFNEAILQVLIKAAKIGMKFADEYPHWISVEDELPKENSGMAVVVNYMGHLDFMKYCKSGWHNDKRWCVPKGIITHWMPLPKPPLVTDLNKKDLPPVSWQEGNILVEEEGGEE